MSGILSYELVGNDTANYDDSEKCLLSGPQMPVISICRQTVGS